MKSNFYNLGIDKAEEFYEEILKYADMIEMKSGPKARLQYELGVNFILSTKANENALRSFNKLKGDLGFVDDESVIIESD